MEIRSLPADEDALRRYAAELWLPYHRELAERVEAHALADWPDERFVECNVEFTRTRLEAEGTRGWVAVTADAGVDVDNERALAFYEKQGFEGYRKRLTRRVE